MITTTTSNPADALINSLNASSSSLASSKTGSSVSDMQDRFMKLLVTQLQNQDPLNPMDNAQMTSQLAQMSTVSGVSQLNATLMALSNSMSAGSATSMIGHGVLVKGNALNLSAGRAVGGINLDQPADGVQLTIKDAAGNVVRNMTLGAQQAGTVPFAWDGLNDAGLQLADGKYSFTAQAVYGTDKQAATSLSYGTVNAVTPGQQGQTTKLEIGQLGSYDMSSIVMIL